MADSPGSKTTRSTPRWARPVELGLFFVGAILAAIFLVSIFEAIVVVAVAALLTACAALRDQLRHAHRSRRAIGILAWLLLISWHLLCTYLAVAWGSVLYWSVDLVGWLLFCTATIGFVVGAARPTSVVRVPAIVPLGLWLTLCLHGWQSEERVVRCNDVLASKHEHGVRVIVPTSPALENCAPGTSVAIGRYPRSVRQFAGARLWVTSQSASGAGSAPGNFTGSVCAVDPGQPPECVGEGKAQRLIDATARGEILVATWGELAPSVRGRLLALSPLGPPRVQRQASFDSRFAEMFYDPGADRIHGMTDEGHELIPVVASTFEVLPSIDVPFAPPGAVQYDAARGEGLICVGGGPFTELDGQPYMVVGVRGRPLTLRALGASAWLTRVAMTWGCDWDPERRRAYVAIPNLGLLATLDYDSGELLRTDFVGFGLRSVTFDAVRQRVYLTSFLGGEVLAVETATGKVAARWQVGRFPRDVSISPDGQTLYVGTNLGVVAIEP